MSLTSQQIERYSRQIIVPRVGGLAQERLLAASVVIAGTWEDAEPALLYLAGAGVGTIRLELAGDHPAIGQIASSIAALNPDVMVAASETAMERAVLKLGIIGSDSLNSNRMLLDNLPGAGWVWARLDTPARVALLPAGRGCPRCVNGNLLAAFGARAENARVIAMAATVEAFKLLAGYVENPRPVLVEFDGYESRSQDISAVPGCACGRGGA